MKITAISPLSDANPRSIVELISTLHSELIVLPGFAKNTPSATALQKVLRPGVKVFLESADKLQAVPWLVSQTGIVSMPKQVFAQNPTTQALRNLESSFPHRTFLIGKRRVSFILCGEINAFRADGLAKVEIDLPFEVLVNPAHSLMGRWHILGPKLRALSKGRTVVHVANNTRRSRALTTDIRIYRDGEQVGQRGDNDDAAWCTYDIKYPTPRVDKDH